MFDATDMYPTVYCLSQRRKIKIIEPEEPAFYQEYEIPCILFVSPDEISSLIVLSIVEKK